MRLLAFAFSGSLNFTKDAAINCLLLIASFLFVERSRKPIVAVLFGLGWGAFLIYVLGVKLWP
jgi:hypothetical protein